MLNNIINLDTERIKRYINSYDAYEESISTSKIINGSGHETSIIIPIQPSLRQRHLDNKTKFTNELNLEYETIINSLHTHSPRFKFPTTMRKYHNDVNPTLCIHQEWQIAATSLSHDIYMTWVIELVGKLKEGIISALHDDLCMLDSFIIRIENNRFNAEPPYLNDVKRLRTRLNTALIDFTNHNA